MMWLILSKEDVDTTHSYVCSKKCHPPGPTSNTTHIFHPIHRRVENNPFTNTERD